MAKPFQRLETDWLLASFGRKKESAIVAYKKFIGEGKNQPSLWKELRNQVYLGGEEFVSQLQSLIERDKDFSEVPAS